MKWLMGAGVGLALGSGVIAPSPAQADVWEDQVRAQLLFAGTAAISMGFEVTYSRLRLLAVRSGLLASSGSLRKNPPRADTGCPTA